MSCTAAGLTALSKVGFPNGTTTQFYPARRHRTRCQVRGADQCHAAAGRRLQNRKRFKTVEAAREWHAKTSAELATGTHTAPSNVTVKQAVDAWLTAKAIRVKPTTRDAYSAALAPVVDRYGQVKVQAITKHDVEALVSERRGGTTDRGVWKRTSITPCWLDGGSCGRTCMRRAFSLATSLHWSNHSGSRAVCQR